MIVESETKKRTYYETDLFKLSCSCEAGKYGKLCKHLKKMAKGEVDIEASYNPKHFKRIKEPEQYTFLSTWRSKDLWSERLWR